MLSRIDYFNDAHLHAIAVRDWQQTYSQISAGSLQSSLARFTGPHFQVIWEHLNQRVAQHGAAPPGSVCFALPIAIPGAACLHGLEPDDSSIFAMSGGREFMCHTPAGWEVMTFTFDRDFFEQTSDAIPRADNITRLFKRAVVKVSPHRLARSRHRLLRLFTEALIDPDSIDGVEVGENFARSLVDELLQLIIDPTCDNIHYHGHSSSSFIVERCHRLTVADAPNPPTVQDLCHLLHTSRRAVQRGFRHVAQTTPVNYLRCIRLNGARRDLTNTYAVELSIGDIAAQWGFFHLSHFAAEYKALFGELPSQTKRLAAPTM